MTKMMKCELNGIIRLFIADSFIKYFAYLLCAIVCKVFSFIDCCLPERPKCGTIRWFCQRFEKKERKKKNADDRNLQGSTNSIDKHARLNPIR